MSNEATLAKPTGPGIAKVITFWAVFLLNILVLTLFWLSQLGGGLGAILPHVLFGAVVIPGFFVLVSQVAKKARNREARMDAFILVSVFVLLLFGIALFASAA